MRKLLAALIVTLFLASMLSISTPAKAYVPPGTLTLPDAELNTFAYEWGPGSLALITDIPGLGVKFDFTGLDPSSGTGVGDNFPVSSLAGGVTKDYGYGFVGPYDFSLKSRYSMVFKNVGANPVTLNIFMNTGWTVDWSGGLWTGPDGYGASWARNTYWQNTWTYLDVGQYIVVTLDFSSAEVYGASDDPNPLWQYPDGTTGVTVQRLDEVSNIGFQVLGNGAGSVIVASDTHLTTALIADETIPVGTVTVLVVGTDLVVTYSLDTGTYPDYYLLETHLSVSTTWPPVNKGTNPKVGKFEYSMTFAPPDMITGLGGTQSYTYYIPITDPAASKTYTIAAQADVHQFGWVLVDPDSGTNPYPSGDEYYIFVSVAEMTAWGEGTPFSGHNWAMYFTYPMPQF